MNPAISDMLRPYNPQTPLDWVHAIREVVQEVALLGMWRSGFFNQAAFYGGTALRIFHGLNRFSEDLDFSLSNENDSVRLENALDALALELEAWGFSFEAVSKSSGERSGIESAFLKGNTRVNLLNIGVPDALGQHFPGNQKISIKLELDTSPPSAASTEMKTHLLPTPFQARLYDLPSLFAGKLHTVLFRDWKRRVKGRDFYDFIWFVGRETPVNLKHLAARIRQSGGDCPDQFEIACLRNMLLDRFEQVDFAAAAEEVRPYLRDPRELTLWTKPFFHELARLVKGAEQRA